MLYGVVLKHDLQRVSFGHIYIYIHTHTRLGDVYMPVTVGS